MTGGYTFEIPLSNGLMAGLENRLGKEGSKHLSLNWIPATRFLVYYGLKRCTSVQ